MGSTRREYRIPQNGGGVNPKLHPSRPTGGARLPRATERSSLHRLVSAVQRALQSTGLGVQILPDHTEGSPPVHRDLRSAARTARDVLAVDGVSIEVRPDVRDARPSNEDMEDALMITHEHLGIPAPDVDVLPCPQPRLTDDEPCRSARERPRGPA